MCPGHGNQRTPRRSVRLSSVVYIFSGAAFDVAEAVALRLGANRAQSGGNVAGTVSDHLDLNLK